MAEIAGAPELEKMLDALPLEIFNKVVPGALGKAATPIVRQLRNAIRSEPRKAKPKPKPSGNRLARTIGRRIKKYKRTGVIVVVIGGRWPKGAHLHLYDQGHRMVTQGTARRVGLRSSNTPGQSSATGVRGGGTVGNWVPGTFVVRRAWQSVKAPSMNVIIQDVRTGIERVAAREAKKRGVKP